MNKAVGKWTNGLSPRLMIINAKTGAVELNHELSSGYTGIRNIHP